MDIQEKKNKEQLVPARIDFLFDHDHFLKNQPVSNLDPDVKKFLTFILDRYMPFGILNLNVFTEANQVLNLPYDGRNEDVVLRRFFQLIPIKFVPNTIPGKLEMLRRLSEITTKLQTGIREGLNGGMNALDYFYEHYFDINLIPIQDVDLIMGIQNRYDIECLFKVEKRNQNVVTTKVGPTKLLLHPPFPNNVLGILKEGLRKRSSLPHVERVRRLNHGDGIYFYDNVSTALKKFNTSFYEVVLFYCTTIYSEKYDHWCVPGEEEYVVREENQVKIEYVIKMKRRN